MLGFSLNFPTLSRCLPWNWNQPEQNQDLEGNPPENFNERKALVRQQIQKMSDHFEMRHVFSEELNTALDRYAEQADASTVFSEIKNLLEQQRRADIKYYEGIVDEYWSELRDKYMMCACVYFPAVAAAIPIGVAVYYGAKLQYSDDPKTQTWLDDREAAIQWSIGAAASFVASYGIDCAAGLIAYCRKKNDTPLNKLTDEDAWKNYVKIIEDEVSRSLGQEQSLQRHYSM